MRKGLGAKYADVGCIYLETFGCIVGVFGCKSMEQLGACLTVFALPDNGPLLARQWGALPDSR